MTQSLRPLLPRQLQTEPTRRRFKEARLESGYSLELVARTRAQKCRMSWRTARQEFLLIVTVEMILLSANIDGNNRAERLAFSGAAITSATDAGSGSSTCAIVPCTRARFYRALCTVLPGATHDTYRARARRRCSGPARRTHQARLWYTEPPCSVRAPPGSHWGSAR